jgi:hypothetical protein
MDLSDVAEKMGLGTEFARAMARAAKMTPDERRERMAMARAATEIFQLGTNLEEMAIKRADDATLAWIEEREILDRDRVWPLDEAATLKLEILDRMDGYEQAA